MQSGLVLLKIFSEDNTVVQKAITNYRIGTFGDYCVFPNITQTGKIAQARLMKYNAITGERRKNDNRDISSLPYELKKQGKLKDTFETDKTVFFGEHLTDNKTRIISIVESQKTAIICSILFSNRIWLATGSKSFIQTDKLRKFRRQEIILYPDADGFKEWTEKTRMAQLVGLDVKCSSLIEKSTPDYRKSGGFDLANYLLNVKSKL